MIVFKNYFNIVKRHLGVILMFSAISIGVSVINTSYTSTEDYVHNPAESFGFLLVLPQQRQQLSL